MFFLIMNYGKIALCSPKGESARILRDYGLEGLIFNPDDPASLLRALTYVKENTGDILEIISHIRTDFAWANLANTYGLEDIYS